jgi:hypothetical protein
MNEGQPEGVRLKDKILEEMFRLWWPKLEEALTGTDQLRPGENESGLPWLWSTDELSRLLDQNVPSTVWVITPNLVESVDEMRDAIKRAKTQYTFITKPSNRNEDAKRKVRRWAGANLDKMKFKELSEDEFQKKAATKYVIVEPDDQIKAYLVLPIELPNQWIEVSMNAANDFASRFSECAAEAESLPPV